MAARATIALSFLLFFFHGCSRSGTGKGIAEVHRAPGSTPQYLAVYEAWFGHPQHISVGYSSQDPIVLHEQIKQAKAMGISGFVVDWYGYRQPFIDRSYALMQAAAAQENFHVAMMYDESDDEDGATDEAIEDFKLFHKTYLAQGSAGREAYLTYKDRPVIFIFPKGKHTDWTRVRTEVNKWDKAPLLIDEFPPGSAAQAIDGYYAWVSPGPKGWAASGANWGEEYLNDFYTTMQTKFPDKIAVGGAWAKFDDSKASWGLNRHIDARCGQTFTDTLALWHQHYASSQNDMPYMLVETWDDYEEGTAIEPGIPDRGAKKPPIVLQ